MMPQRLFIPIGVAILIMSVAVVGCSQTTTVASPTNSPAASANSEQPGPTVQPIAINTQTATQPAGAASASVSFPEKGKNITIIVPYAAGGSSDLTTRLVAAGMEKEFGISVQVVCKPGGGSQVGLTELAKSKPDGYTLAHFILPTVITTYADPERQAEYSRSSFQSIGNYGRDIMVIIVDKDSKYETLADMIDEAKANPKQIKVGTAGFMTNTHLDLLRFQKLAGVEFGIVHFDGATPAGTALFGNHIDAVAVAVGNYASHYKSGKIRILGIMSDKPSRFYPEAPTCESQGYKIYGYATRSLLAPSGTPKEVVDILANTMKKTVESPEYKQKMDDMVQEIDYMGPEELDAYWAETEKETIPMIDLAKEQK